MSTTASPEKAKTPPTTLDEAWQAFTEGVTAAVLDPSVWQLLKIAFYSGAAATFSLAVVDVMAALRGSPLKAQIDAGRDEVTKIFRDAIVQPGAGGKT